MQRLESFLYDTAEHRYELLLQYMPDLLESVPLYHIASYLGVRGPSLSRIRRRMANRKSE